jgi:FkbM family methyltransferase
MASSQDASEARRRASITRTINAGFAHHQAGRLERAEVLYRRALEKDPDHAEVLHLLGVVAYQRGDSAGAIALIGRALPALQEFSEAHLNFGNALREAGRLAEAADSYRRAIALRPDDGIAHSNLGRALNDQGLFEAGLDSARRAITLNPEFLGAHVNCAAALLSLGRFAEAEMPLRQAIALTPDLAEIHHDLASMLVRVGRLDEAAQSYERALVLRPGLTTAHYGLALTLIAQEKPREAVAALSRLMVLEAGVLETQLKGAAALLGLGQFADAEAPLRRALKLKPDRAETHRDLGSVLTELGRVREAVVFHDQALALSPNDATIHYALGRALHRAGDLARSEACFRRALALAPDYRIHNHLGVVLQRRGELDEALTNFEQALRLSPNQAQTHNNLGAALVALGRLDKGIAHYHRALALEPKQAETHNNLGNVLQRQGRLDAAMESYERALVHTPDHAEARFNRSLVLLQRGDFAQGWTEYEWRWRYQGAFPKRHLGRPAWSGEPLQGKTILIYAEQGLGDTLQFVRLVPILAERGARVLLEVPPPLVAVVRSSGIPATVIPQGPEPPAFDVQQALMSLPRVLGLTEAGLRGKVPYLAADPERVAAWRERLPARGFRVGVVWQGRPNVGVDRGRSVPLRALAPIAALPGVRLISLQKNDGLEQLEALPEGMHVETLGPGFDAGPDAFLDTAAVMMSLDLVISSDTSVAHLAGALARPVWICLQHVADWRWMLEREDSPWYPTARLFRQRQPGDWDELFARMTAELARGISGKRDRSLPGARSGGVGGDTNATPNPTTPRSADGAGPTTTVLKQCRHGRMLFLPYDRYIGRSLDLYGEYSELEAEVFARALRPGDLVIEVGANIGAHTIHLAKLVGPRGRVVAFEPQHVLFQLLCANIALNELFNVRTYHAAVGRETATIRVPPIDYMVEANFGGVSLNTSGPGEEVPLWRLDSLALAAPRLVKVDVEGMESDVLAGARETIAQFRPLLYVENDRRPRSEALITQISEFGYEMWWHVPPLYNPDNFAKNGHNEFRGIVSANLLCIPKETPVAITGLRQVSGPNEWLSIPSTL